MFICIYWTSLVLVYTGYKQILKQSQLKTVWNVRMESMDQFKKFSEKKGKTENYAQSFRIKWIFFMYKPLCSVFSSLSISFTSSDASLFFSWQIYVMKPSISSMDRYIISFIYHVYILNMLFSKFCWFLPKLHCLLKKHWTVKKNSAAAASSRLHGSLNYKIEHYCHLLGVWYTQHPSSLEYLLR